MALVPAKCRVSVVDYTPDFRSRERQKSVSATASKPVPGLTSPSSYRVCKVLEAYEVGRWPVKSTYELKGLWMFNYGVHEYDLYLLVLLLLFF